MEMVRETEKKYCSLALGIAVFAAIVCFLLAYEPAGKGLILGCLFSIANFLLMGETLPMRIGHSRKKITAIAFLLILVRYALLAIPLAVSIKLDQINLAGTVFGLFSVQLVIMADHISHLIKTKKEHLF
jgi:hypothetical protein